MKYFLTLLLSFFIYNNAFAAVAGKYVVPSTYTLSSQKGDIFVYQHTNQNTFAIVVDTAKSQFDFGGTMGYAGDGKYYRGDILEHWNKNSSRLAKPVLMVNGSFFQFKPIEYKLSTSVTLSFPLKDGYTNYSVKNTDPSNDFRSLYIKSSPSGVDTVHMVNGIRDNIGANIDFNIFHDSATKSYITGLVPAPIKNPNSKIGRNYIGGIPTLGCNPRKALCNLQYLVFFIAFSSTHDNMVKQMDDWQILSETRMMMDGSGSTQIFLNTTGNYMNKGDDNGRKIPNVILVGNK